MSILQSINNQISSLPNRYYPSSEFLIGMDSLRILKSDKEVWDHLNYDPLNHFKVRSLLGFKVYIDSSKTGITFGNHKFFGIDPESVIEIKL